MPSVADYFASLILKSDKRTFDMGNKDLERTEKNIRKMGEGARQNSPRFDQFTKGMKNFSAGVSKGQAATHSLTGAMGSLEIGTMGFIGVAGLAIGAFAAVEGGAMALAAATGKSSQNLIGQAASTGLGVEALMKWHRAAQMIGMDSGAMDSTFSSMRMQAAQFKTWGDLNADQLKNLSMLGEQQGGGKGFVDKWLGMNPEQKVRAVFQVAQGMKDVDKAALLVNQTLGGSGETLFWSLAGRGKGLESLLSDASSIGLLNSKDIKTSAAFGDDLSTVKTIIKEFKDLLGADFAKQFAAPLKNFIDWYANNKEEIRQLADNIATALKVPFEAAGAAGAWVSKTMSGNQKEAANSSKWYLNKDKTALVNDYSDVTFQRSKYGDLESLSAALNKKGNVLEALPNKNAFGFKYSQEDLTAMGSTIFNIDGLSVVVSESEKAVWENIASRARSASTNRIGVTK